MMPKITLYAVGKLRQQYQACADIYDKRIKDLTIVEITPSKEKSASQRLQKEAAEFEKKMKSANMRGKPLMIMLDAGGENISSEVLADMLAQAKSDGRTVNFLIGGADGFAESLRAQADKKIAFGKNIWAHELVRVMLLEQIYRADTIHHNHPYHSGH